MSAFDAKSLVILGRQPALGIAELEALYGGDRIKALNNAALLDIPPGEINFLRLGGSIKVAKILNYLPLMGWQEIIKYLQENIPKHLQNLPMEKLTLGVSLYGFDTKVSLINSGLLQIKKKVKAATGRPVRVIPNKEVALNSAQVLHNKLTTKGGWELLVVHAGNQIILAQTIFIQDIEAYGDRDQKRPKRDARVGMLPPKLAQILINLAVGHIEKQILFGQIEERPNKNRRVRILDPFCGTGVILQEALLMGYHVIGTDLEPRMVDFSKANMQWLFKEHPKLEGQVVVEQADATHYRWPPFSVVASETYLGRPLATLPETAQLKKIISDVNTITTRFLKNIFDQLKSDQIMVLAVPAWKLNQNQLINLPVIDKLSDLGYNHLDFKHVKREDLIYFRPNQIVARRIIRIKKN